MVKENLDVAASPQMKDGFAALKTKVESVYECLGITCADVGEFQTSSGVYTGMEACTDASTETPATPSPTAGASTPTPTAADTAADADADDEDVEEAESGAIFATHAMLFIDA